MYFKYLCILLIHPPWRVLACDSTYVSQTYIYMYVYLHMQYCFLQNPNTFSTPFPRKVPGSRSDFLPDPSVFFHSSSIAHTKKEYVLKLNRLHKSDLR